MTTRCVDYLVKRDDWGQGRFVESEIPELSPGEVLFRVDRFAFTANNVTYAQAGDMLDYWGFFPAEDGWGRIPAMGYADVIRSAHDGVPEGQRVFGFFPMATHLVIQADQVSPHQYVDAAAHRANHAPAYRQYGPTTADAAYDVDREDATMLLRGLFMTSFLVDDFIADGDFYGAESFVISSASSKTGIALAYQLSQRGRGPVIGLTSQRNREFVEKLGYYDQTLLYDDIESLPKDRPVAFIDHSGNGDVVNGMHRHLGDNVKYSCIVGATHWGSAPRAENLPGAAPTFFFAPAQIQKRAKDWGADALQERLGTAWTRFRAASDEWLEVRRSQGPAGVERAYREVLEGRASPSVGHVLSLHD